MNDGPTKVVTTRYICDNCSHLHTKDWSFMGENDDLDTGTDARCMVLDKHIESYYHKGHDAPKWCPKKEE